MQTGKPLTVYIIDDDPEYHELYRRYLEGFPEWTFNLIFQADPAFDPADTVRHAPELIFLDYVLGGRTGLQVLSQIRLRNQDSAVIVFTGQGDERMAAEIIRAGADDYVPKTDLTADVLRLSVAHALDRFRLRAERKLAEEEREERDRFNAVRAAVWRLAASPLLSERDIIQQILDLAGPALRVSRACYNLVTSGDAECAMEWCEPGASPTLGFRTPARLIEPLVGRDISILDRQSALDRLPAALKPLMEKVLLVLERKFNIESIASVALPSENPVQTFLTFDICRNRPARVPWNEERKKMAVELSRIIAQILARRRAEEAKGMAEKMIEEQNRFNALRAEIWQIAADKTLDEAALVQRLLETLGPALNLSRAVYIRRNPDDDHLVCTQDWHMPGLEPVLGVRLPPVFWRRIRTVDLTRFDSSKVPATIRVPLMAYLRRYGIQTYISLLHGKFPDISGYFAFLQNDHMRKWTWLESDILTEMLKIFQSRSQQMQIEREVIAQNRINALRAVIWRIAAEKMKNRDMTIQNILDTLGPGLGLSRAVYHIYERSSGDCVVRLEWRAEGLPTVIGDRMPSFVIQRSLKKTKTFDEIIITSDDHLSRPARIMLRTILRKFGVRAYVTVPLGRASELDGFFAFVQNDRDRTWTQNELSLLLEVSKLFTIKSDQAKAELDALEQNRLNALRAAIWKIAADEALNRDGLIRELLAAAGPGLALNRAGFHRFDPASGDIVLAMEWVAEGFRPAAGEIRMPSALWRKVKESRPMTQDLEGVPALLRPLFRKKLREFGIAACVLIPCSFRSEFYGNFSFIQNDHERQWKAREIEILQEIVNIVMARLERLEAGQALAEQNRSNALRADIWKIAADKSLAEHDLIQGILDAMGSALNIRNALFIRNDPSAGYFTVLNEWKRDEAFVFLGTRVPHFLARPFLGRPYFSSDSGEIPAAIRVPLRGLFKVQGVGSYLVVAIGDPGEPEGLFAFVTGEPERRWKPLEIGILTETARILLLRMRQLAAERAMLRMSGGRGT